MRMMKYCTIFTAILFFLTFVYSFQKFTHSIYHSLSSFLSTFQIAPISNALDDKFIFKNVQGGRNIFVNEKKVCLLPELNPWDERLQPYMSPVWDPLKNCVIHQVMHTELKNGLLRQLKDSKLDCAMRCLYSNDEKSVERSQWYIMKKNVTYRLACEFIEINCTDGGEKIFRYIHSQVIRLKNKHFQMEDKQNPSVFIFVIDAVSASSARRFANETINILQQDYSATFFYYHNKVGDNSRPNAVAMFSGDRITELDSKQFGQRSASEVNDSCKYGLNKNVTITYNFVDKNYMVAFVEDWGSAFGFPDCKGYGKPPADHYVSPFLLHINDPTFEKIFYKNECQERHHKFLDCATRILETYQKEAKFMMVWLSEPAHDHFTGLYRVDELFANFFRKHSEPLKQSFVFVMGDHGLHYGEPRLTPIGYIEDNNPLLMVAVPEHLRSNKQLMNNLRANSYHHTSQYDFYATLYDIANVARLGNYEKWNEHDFSAELGSARGGIRARSLLRPINRNRTCAEMEIPDEYCLCERPTSAINTTSTVVQKAAEQLIFYLNDLLAEYDQKKVCSEISLNEIHRAEQFVGQERLKLLIVIKPSMGKIEAELRNSETINGYEVISTSVVRVDSYGQQGHCVYSAFIRSFCYCKKQLTR